MKIFDDKTTYRTSLYRETLHVRVPTILASIHFFDTLRTFDEPTISIGRVTPSKRVV